MAMARTEREKRAFCRNLRSLNPRQKGMCREYFDIFSAVLFAARNTLSAPLIYSTLLASVHCSLEQSSTTAFLGVRCAVMCHNALKNRRFNCNFTDPLHLKHTLSSGANEL